MSRLLRQNGRHIGNHFVLGRLGLCGLWLGLHWLLLLLNGLRLLLCGFFRKCAVADLCGVYVNRVFAQAEQASSFAIFLAGALFCFQMYCDFAGYSEIAAGSARLMGIRLMKNFDQPYLSQSYGEFFRRWHISLNRWFTSYVYIPLGGSRRGTARRMLNTLIVFTLCGLWHGARWNYREGLRKSGGCHCPPPGSFGFGGGSCF